MNDRLKSKKESRKSGQAIHITCSACYRCFLPDLAGFTGDHCMGPGQLQLTVRANGVQLHFED